MQGAFDSNVPPLVSDWKKMKKADEKEFAKKEASAKLRYEMEASVALESVASFDKDVYHALNNARTNPKSFIPDLEAKLKNFEGKVDKKRNI